MSVCKPIKFVWFAINGAAAGMSATIGPTLSIAAGANTAANGARDASTVDGERKADTRSTFCFSVTFEDGRRKPAVFL